MHVIDALSLNIIPIFIGGITACFVEIFCIGLGTVLNKINDHKPLWTAICPFCLGKI